VSCVLELTVLSSSQDGSWAQEAIEGMFNRTVAISCPGFKLSFTIWMLGKADSYLKRLKAEKGTNGFAHGH
jgi:lanosterol synthase